jgi:hypothetical protein
MLQKSTATRLLLPERLKPTFLGSFIGSKEAVFSFR